MQMMLLFLKQNRTKQNKTETITMQYYEMEDIPTRENGTKKESN